MESKERESSDDLGTITWGSPTKKQELETHQQYIIKEEWYNFIGKMILRKNYNHYFMLVKIVNKKTLTLLFIKIVILRW